MEKVRRKNKGEKGREYITKRKAESKEENAKKARLQSDELIVQRLSSAVEGKAQKYSRIGPREFIPYKKSDLTLEGIKDGCLTYFQDKGYINKGMEVDILAGERGPTCNSLHQIPDLKLIHVTIIPRVLKWKSQQHPLWTGSRLALLCKARMRLPNQLEVPPRSTQLRLVRLPKCLSISAMLGLGKVVKTPSDSVIINVYTFNMEKLAWSLIPFRAEFQVASIHFGEGGFRRAYRATSCTAEFKGQ